MPEGSLSHAIPMGDVVMLSKMFLSPSEFCVVISDRTHFFFDLVAPKKQNNSDVIEMFLKIFFCFLLLQNFVL